MTRAPKLFSRVSATTCAHASKEEDSKAEIDPPPFDFDLPDYSEEDGTSAPSYFATKEDVLEVVKKFDLTVRTKSTQSPAALDKPPLPAEEKNHIALDLAIRMRPKCKVQARAPTVMADCTDTSRSPSNLHSRQQSARRALFARAMESSPTPRTSPWHMIAIFTTDQAI